jgi:hypothetical protein
MPNAKRSPAKSPAKTNRETPTVASEPTRSSGPYSVGPERLSTTHELIIDAVSDLLTHGGFVEDVDGLIHSAMAHTQRRVLTPICKGQPAEIDKRATGYIRENFDQWKADLAIAWRANKRPEQPGFEAKTISQRIRASRRDQLLDRFGDFMRQATPEELYIMSDVLWLWDCGMVDPIDGVDEIPLGEAFGNALDRNDTYIRIPKDMRARVQRYVDALIAADDKAVV